MQNQEQYRGIVTRLTSLQAKIAYLDSLRGLLWISSFAIILFGILIGISMISWPSIPARLVIDLVFLGILATAFYFWVVRPFTDRRGLLAIARMLEARYGKFQSRLIAALELYDLARKNREGYSIELIEKTIEEAGGVIAGIDVNAVVDYRPIIRASARAGVLVILALAGLVVSPSKVHNTWFLYSHPGTDFARPPEFTLTINPSGGEFNRNMDLVIRAVPTGKVPRRVDLYYKFEDGTWASESMTRPQNDSTTAFAYTFKKIKRSLDVYARSGRVESAKAHLEVVDPPRLTNISLTFDYPAYSGLPSATSNPNDGNVAALRGTKVTIEATANKPLSDSYQVFSDSSKARLNVDDDRVTGAFTVKDYGRYTVILHDQAGRQNPEPIWYDIQALDDYLPAIEIRFPGTDVDLNEKMMLPLVIAISDDYGFGKLNVVWWILSEGKQSEPARESIAIPDRKTLDQLVNYMWNVQSLNPLPGDLIYYYAEVSDNDVISGPKWSRSKTYTARLPNLDEILADVQNSQDQQMETLDEALKNQKELQKQIEEVARDMLKSTEVDWEKQQEAKKVLEKQQDIARKLDDLAKEMNKNLDRLEENRLVGEQIAEKMQELQQLMEQVAPPELKDAMRKLQEAIEKMDPAELKKALEQFQLTSKQLLENLDRALSLLQKLAIEQKLDMLVQMAEKLEADQNKINENVNAASDSSSLADQAPSQKNASDEFNTLKDQFGQLAKMDEVPQMIPEQEKREASQQINNPETPQDMQDMKGGMCSGSSGMCQNKGKKISRNLSQVSQALRNAQKAMQRQQKLDIARKMQRAAEDLLYLSSRQETLLDSTRANQSTGDGLRKMASSQMEIASASSRVADMISELSKETIFINITLLKLLGQALSEMGDATNHLDKRYAGGAVQSQSLAMSDLNKLVFLMLQAKNNAMSSSSGSGMQEMMDQLQQMSQKQGGINQETMMMVPRPGMQLSMGQQQALQQLAAQQQALSDMMEKLNEEFGKRGEMLGRLDALGEEMKKVAEDLQKSHVDQETVKRQERILTRLLDAQKSVNRQEFSRQRKAEQGTDVIRKSPTLPDDFLSENGWLSSMIKKALEEQYPRQYEKLIRAYFKSIQNEGTPVEK